MINDSNTNLCERAKHLAGLALADDPGLMVETWHFSALEMFELCGHPVPVEVRIIRQISEEQRGAEAVAGAVLAGVLEYSTA